MIWREIFLIPGTIEEGALRVQLRSSYGTSPIPLGRSFSIDKINEIFRK